MGQNASEYLRTVRALAGALLIPLAAGIVSCASLDPKDESYRRDIVQELTPLFPGAPASRSGPLGEYGTDFLHRLAPDASVFQYLGYLPSGEFRIFVHILVPAASRPGSDRGTAFIFHGFATESSRYTALARALLNEGWWVVLADLPGHGLSSGERGGAEDFSIYGDAVRTVVGKTEPYAPGPFLAFGHSTGAAAVMDYTRRGGGAFSAAVFYAPLVRTAYKPLLSALRFLTRPVVKTMRTTSFTRLGVHSFPPAWYDALLRWERSAAEEKSLGLPRTLVVQGSKDGVVANRYNRRFIQDRCADVRFLLIDGGTHYEPDARTPHPEVIRAVMDFASGL